MSIQTRIRSECIRFAYGHAPARGVLRRRRAPQLLAGGRAARRHAAGGQPAGARAREAARARSSSTARGGASSRPRPGLRLYRGAQRLLALEEQLLDERRGRGEGELTGTLRDRRLDRPGRDRAPAPPLRVPARAPGLDVSLSVFDTQTIVERVAARELELGVVGAARRHRGVALRAVLPRRGDPRVPARPPVRRPHRHARRAPRRDADRDAGGRRRAADDRGRAARASATRLRDLDVRLELGLQESVTQRRPGRLRRHVHLAHVGRARPRRRHARRGARRRARLEREISLVRATGRTATRAADAFVEFAREQARDRVIVRWSLAELPGCWRARVGGRCSSRASAGAEARPAARRGWSEVPSHRIEVPRRARLAARRRRRHRDRHRARPPPPRPGCRSSRCRRRTPAPSGRRSSASAPPTGRCSAAARARTSPRSSTSRADARPAARRDGRHRAERARALRRGALRRRAQRRGRRRRARRRAR